MVGLGILMIFTGISAAYLYSRKKLFKAKWFHRWCVVMAPSGFFAVLAGWFVTEIGRQPYTVYGVLRTAEGVSNVPGEAMLVTLVTFIVVYTVVFGAAVFYILRLMAAGPKKLAKKDTSPVKVGVSGRLSDKEMV